MVRFGQDMTVQLFFPAILVGSFSNPIFRITTPPLLKAFKGQSLFILLSEQIVKDVPCESKCDPPHIFCNFGEIHHMIMIFIVLLICVRCEILQSIVIIKLTSDSA